MLKWLVSSSDSTLSRRVFALEVSALGTGCTGLFVTFPESDRFVREQGFLTGVPSPSRGASAAVADRYRQPLLVPLFLKGPVFTFELEQFQS